MRPSKREVIQYGIAIDLVILAAGVGLLYPQADVLFAAFAGAAALSAWKGRWRGAWTAILASIIVEFAMFGEVLEGARIALIATASVAIAWGVRSIVAFRAIASAPPAADPYIDDKIRALEERERAEAERRAAIVPMPAPFLVALPPPPPPAPPPVRTGEAPVLHRKSALRLLAPKKAPPVRRKRIARATPKKVETTPRLLLFERRRGTADTIVPKLRQRGVEVEVVERLVDAADEMFRFRPHALFIDSDLPDFEKHVQALTQQNSKLPLFITGRALHAPKSVRYVQFVVRPYDVDELASIARRAYERPEDLVVKEIRPPAPTPVAAPQIRVAPQPQQTISPDAQQREGTGYDVTCFSCRAVFDAMEADWCSCLTKERTFLCTNCLVCFCKAPPSYKERFWVGAPQALFERKTTDARRASTLPPNPPPHAVTRPLVLCVDDDEEIQFIVHRVCTNLEYGIIHALNGQDGLDVAREYKPNFILSDAFMPKLDGREMCRVLRQELAADTKMVVMTGLYTDTKYRSEALKRFHVDDYLSKPVAVTELINLLQKHLEGVTGLPAQEDMYEAHRRDAEIGDEDVPLATLMEEEVERPVAPKIQVKDAYNVACFNCGEVFDATRAEWCSCVGRDNTLVCPHCHGCFCKAPAQYRERFWTDAPPSVFERKMLGSKRHITAGVNPAPDNVKRPLILLVEDDENVQLIVRTVVTSMGFGFVVGANGQEGLTLAREYTPDLILSDAFMPKLDGREMCRLLKLDPATAGVKAIIMTGLYTDRKYRNEALDYFKVDDYVAKPLAVDDLIKLFKKHLPQELPQAM